MNIINWKLTTTLIWIGITILFLLSQLPAGIFIIITLWALPQVLEVWKED